MDHNQSADQISKAVQPMPVSPEALLPTPCGSNRQGDNHQESGETNDNKPFLTKVFEDPGYIRLVIQNKKSQEVGADVKEGVQAESPAHF